MPLHRISTFAPLCAALVLVGCQRPATSNAPADKPEAAEATTTADSPPPEAAADVSLAILSYDEIQQHIASHRGKVVVMDAWSTSCPPCLKDFHNLVELHKQYGPEQVACISLSFDFEGGRDAKPEDVAEPVLKFLVSQQATFDNVLSSEDSDSLYKKFELNSVPAIFVYDRSGQLRERFEKEGAYEQVRKLVAELVKQPAPAGAASPAGN
jgi:thiol-disulfide isomerase/thioredoxin